MTTLSFDMPVAWNQYTNELMLMQKKKPNVVISSMCKWGVNRTGRITLPRFISIGYFIDSKNNNDVIFPKANTRPIKIWMDENGSAYSHNGQRTLRHQVKWSHPEIGLWKVQTRFNHHKLYGTPKRLGTNQNFSNFAKHTHFTTQTLKHK